MADLPIPTGRGGPNQLSEAAVAYAQEALSDNTRRAFGSSWRSFVSWCASEGRTALPADAATIADYVAARALEGLAVSTLALHIAAIRKAHTRMGREAPRGPALDAVWAGIRNRHGRPPKKKRPVTVAVLKKLLAELPGDDLASVRDRALMLVCFAGAMRRGELVSLSVGHAPAKSAVRAVFVAEGVQLEVARSKGDQTGRGATVAIPHGRELCAVAALSAWLKRAPIATGFVFRRVAGGALADGHVSDRYVARLVKRCAKKAGFNPDDFSGHSFRRGLATEAWRKGAKLEIISGHLRHAKLETTLGYVEQAERFRRNAAGKVL